MIKMPYCITCGKIEEQELMKKISIIERKKAEDFPDFKFRIEGIWFHKKIGIIQYFRCKWIGHNCYFW